MEYITITQTGSYSSHMDQQFIEEVNEAAKENFIAVGVPTRTVTASGEDQISVLMIKLPEDI